MRFDDTGRFVWCPEADGSVHLYWKWHAGQWRGWYVYWRMNPGDNWADAVQGLTDKVGEVYRGLRKPIKDTPRPD